MADGAFLTADVWSGQREQALEKAKQIEKQFKKKLEKHKVFNSCDKCLQTLIISPQTDNK